MRLYRAAFLLVFVFQLTALPALGQVSKEYQVKAVFLWRLAQFADWPTNAFENDRSPIVIGVLGENPFGDALTLTVRGETAHGRKLMVQQHARVDEIRSCHILFISGSEAARAKNILAALAGKSILTVSDIDGFARLENGMIGFKSEQSRIALEVNLDATKAARLALDARLLRMAELVRSP